MEFDGLAENPAKIAQDVIENPPETLVSQSQSFSNTILRDTPEDNNENIQSNSENSLLRQTDNTVQKIMIVVNLAIFLTSFIVVS